MRDLAEEREAEDIPHLFEGTDTRVEQDVGRIVDVLTDRQGRPQAAVIAVYLAWASTYRSNAPQDCWPSCSARRWPPAPAAGTAGGTATSLVHRGDHP